MIRSTKGLITCSTGQKSHIQWTKSTRYEFQAAELIIRKLYKSGLWLISLPIGVHNTAYIQPWSSSALSGVGPSVQPYESSVYTVSSENILIFYSHVLHTHSFSQRLYNPSCLTVWLSDHLTWEWPTVQTSPDWSESIICGQSTLKSRHRPYRSIRAISPMVRASWTQYGFHY